MSQDVSHLEAGGFGGTAGIDLGNSHSLPASKVERLGQLARQHLCRHRQPGFSGFDRGPLRAPQTHFHQGQKALGTTIERDHHRDGALLVATDLSGQSVEGADSLHRLSVDLHDDVARPQTGHGLVCRPPGSNAADQHAFRTRAMQLLGFQPGQTPEGDTPLPGLGFPAPGVIAQFGRNAQGKLSLSSPDLHLHGLTDRLGEEAPNQARHFLLELDPDRLAVNAHQDVSRPESGPIRRRARQHSRNQCPLVGRRRSVLQQRLKAGADPGPAHPATLDQFPGDRLGQLAGDGAAQTEPDLVDAHDLTPQVHQGPPGVSRKNAGIVSDPLDQGSDVLPIQAQGSAHALGNHHVLVGDHAAGHRLGDGQGTPHGQDRFSHRKRLRAAEPGDGQGTAGGVPGRHVQLDHGNVGQGVGSYQLRFHLFPSGEDAANRGRLAGHVVVGDDVALPGNDDPAPGGFELAPPPSPVPQRQDIDLNQGRIDGVDGPLDLMLDPRSPARVRRGRGGSQQGGDHQRYQH